MGLVFRLEDYPRYLARVGKASYLDVTRRTDPARIGQVWNNLNAVVRAYGSPWVVQLWTKDPRGVLKKGWAVLRYLQRHGTTLSAQVTVTGLGDTIWEPLVPAEPFVGTEDLVALLGGPNHVKWRYDPIIPAIHDPDRFRMLAERAAELGITQCVINFIAPPGRYSRVDQRISRVLPEWDSGMPHHGTNWQAEVASELVETAGEMGLTVAVCAESAELTHRVPDLRPAACGDYKWFVALSGRDPGPGQARGSRPGCGCAAYFDVGMYGQRLRCHQCLYCYAG